MGGEKKAVAGKGPGKGVPSGRASLVSAAAGAAVTEYHGASDLGLAEWAASVEKMGARGILKEFEALKKECLTKPAGRSEAAFKRSRLQSRYEDVGCWDETRVTLVGRPADADFIHASWVDSVDQPKKYILTQGPLEEVFDEAGTKEFEDTINDFWLMIWERKCAVIVMLCMLEESGKAKCSEYWPIKAKERAIFGDFAVTNKQTEEKKLDGHDIVTSQLIFQKKGDKKTRELAHYWFKTWPDRTCPEKAGPIFDFLEKMEQAHAHLVKKNGMEARGSPIVVHCSAGIGRSGTFVALDVAKTLIGKHGALDVLGIVRKIRLARNAAVQTHAQYASIYVAILDLLRTSKRLPAAFPYPKLLSALNNLLARC